MSGSIRVLIVDDHAMVRRGLRSFLESEEDIQVVGEASGGAEAIRKVQELSPDVVLMDLVMREMDGVTATRSICEQSPTSRVLVLTSFGEDDKVFSSIKAGAIGYLLKDAPAEELGRAIRSVAAGELHLHPDVARKVLNEFASIHKESPPDTELTPREKQVLTLLAGGQSNKEIAQTLNISIKTVKTHVSNILSKLHLVDRTHAAIYATRRGLAQQDQTTRPKSK